jgi:adenylylsulfate kinase-like enzyme
VREQRDPKGLYRRAREGQAPHLPGATETYEEPLAPDLRLDGTRPAVESAEALLARVRSAFRGDERSS